MNCPNCGTAVPENQSHCPTCGAELLTPEQRARRKWERRERERKQKKQIHTDRTAGQLEPIENPVADLVQSLVAELDGMEPPQASETVEEAIDHALELGEEYKPSVDIASEEVTEETQPESETSDMAEEEPAQEEAAEQPAEQSMLERQQGTVHINVEEALASLPQEEQDDIPDIRIPEIFARAKYIPTNSQKWAEQAAKDVENDWEGFDPDNEDWIEEEERPHAVLVLIVGIILLISVLLAAYSYFTSDLTGGIGLTVGSM